MAQCRWCGRSGFFLSLTPNNVCKSCDTIIVMEIDQRIRIINDSKRIIDESKKLDTQLSRCDLILANLRELIKYADRRIITIQPSPDESIYIWMENRDKIIFESIEHEVKDTLAKVKIASSVKTKINQLSKILLQIREYKNKSNNKNLLLSLEKEITDYIHKTQLNFYLDEAKKAEFKGQKKKALDQYYEALYFLMHDEIDDSLQAEIISTIEVKIKELEGNSPI